MKRFLLLFTVLVALLVGCKEKPLLVTDGATSAGTPIVSQAQSAFKIEDANLYETPDDDCFKEIGYNEGYKILTVTFRSSGKTYLYLDFPKEEWETFRVLDSLGGHYNTSIKGKYVCYRYK